MKKICKSKFLILFVVFVLITLLIFPLWIINDLESSECYIGNYDEYICYNGEIYCKICDENKELFSNEFNNSYKDSYITNFSDLEDRTLTIKGFNPRIRFFIEDVRIVYNNPNHDKIVFLELDHSIDVNYYAKADNI